MRRTICLMILMMMTSMLLAQTHWSKYGDAPVLDGGSEGSWDYYFLLTPFVLEVEDTLRMWYAGCADVSEHYEIGYAWSLDGINWTKWSGNPVLELGSTGAWDDNMLFIPRVIYEAGEYTMWYSGHQNVPGSSPNLWRSGIARSTDGIHWEKDALNNPVFEGSHDGSWDDRHVAAFDVRLIGDEYVMCYDGTAEDKPWLAGRATSPDGIVWTRDTLNNPILDVGALGSFDGTGLLGTSVCQVGTSYELFYTGLYGVGAFGYASSDDGISFTKSPWNPIMERGSSGSWDDGTILYQHVSYDPDSSLYHMWYSGEGNGLVGDYAIGYATSLKDFTGLTVMDSYLATGETQIVSATFNGDTTNMAFYAELENAGETLEIQQLFDDGLHEDGIADDGVYANTMTVPVLKTNYWVGLKVTNDNNELINYHALDHFTNIGPIRFQSLEQVYPEGGAIPANTPIYFNLSLQNLETVTTVKDVRVVIQPADTNTTLHPGYSSCRFGDILPGETKSISGYPEYVGLRTAADCPDGTPIYFNIEIMSEGVTYWKDQDILLGNVNTVVGLEESDASVPLSYSLEQNYPNPFNPITSIGYALPEMSQAKLIVFDVLGHEIVTLQEGVKSPGNYKVQWNGLDQDGNQVTTGVYFARLTAGQYSDVIKMVYLR